MRISGGRIITPYILIIENLQIYKPIDKSQKIIIAILALLAVAVASFIDILSTTEPANPIVLEEKVKPKLAVVAEVTTDDSEGTEDVVEEEEKTTTENDQRDTAAVEIVDYGYEAVLKGDLKTISNEPAASDTLIPLDNFSFEATEDPFIYRLLFKEDGVITTAYDHLIAPPFPSTEFPSLSLTNSKDIVFSSHVHSSAGAPEWQQILVNYRTKDAIRFITSSQMLGNVSVRIDYNDTSATFHLDIQTYCNKNTFGTMYMTKEIINEEKEQTVSFPPKDIVCFTNFSHPQTTPIPEIQFQSATKDFATVYFALIGTRYDAHNISVIWTENFTYDTAAQTLTRVNTDPTNVIIFQ